MRCNICNKFASYNEPEVEESSPAEVTSEVSDGEVTFTITGAILVRLTCAECGDALKESEVEYEHTTDPVKLPEGHIVVIGSETWSDNGPNEVTRTEGKGRGMKTFYGFELDGTVDYQTIPDDKEGGAANPAAVAVDAPQLAVLFADDVQASSMDEVQ